MEAAGNRLGLDQRSLDGLRSEAARDPRAAAHQASVQFESLFTQMVLKSMRDATPKTEGGAPGQDTFVGMLDARLSQQLAGRPGGLAEMLERQLTRHMQNITPQPAVPLAAGEDLPAALEVAPALPQRAPAVATAPAALAAPAAPAALAAPVARQYARPSAAASGVESQRGRAATFIQKMLPHAREAERQTGVPASFILGQAALESGWGKAEIRNRDGSTSFNLFGIKATRGWQGSKAQVTTTEFQEGQPVKQKAEFRSYASYTEAFADYARLLASHPRYGEVVRKGGTAETFDGGMQRAGYATDPQYASKLTRTIQAAQALQRTLT